MDAILRMFGLDKLWGVLDGIKAYLTGAITILTGVIGLLQEFINTTSGHSAATLWAFIGGCSHDSNWLMIVAGFGVIAAAHKADKIIAASAPIAPAIVKLGTDAQI